MAEATRDEVEGTPQQKFNDLWDKLRDGYGTKNDLNVDRNVNEECVQNLAMRSVHKARKHALLCCVLTGLSFGREDITESIEKVKLQRAGDSRTERCLEENSQVFNLIWYDIASNASEGVASSDPVLIQHLRATAIWLDETLSATQQVCLTIVRHYSVWTMLEIGVTLCSRVLCNTEYFHGFLISFFCQVYFTGCDVQRFFLLEKESAIHRNIARQLVTSTFMRESPLDLAFYKQTFPGGGYLENQIHIDIKI